MKFSDKLRQERVKAGLTQEELSLQLGVTCRTLQNYESGTVYPKKRELYTKLADFFGTDINYWLTEEQDPAAPLTTDTQPKMQGLASQINYIFNAGDLTEDEIDDFMRVLQYAYWEAKDKAKNTQK